MNILNLRQRIFFRKNSMNFILVPIFICILFIYLFILVWYIYFYDKRSDESTYSHVYDIWLGFRLSKYYLIQKVCDYHSKIVVLKIRNPWNLCWTKSVKEKLKYFCNFFLNNSTLFIIWSVLFFFKIFTKFIYIIRVL